MNARYMFIALAATALVASAFTSCNRRPQEFILLNCEPTPAMQGMAADAICVTIDKEARKREMLLAPDMTTFEYGTVQWSLRDNSSTSNVKVVVVASNGVKVLRTYCVVYNKNQIGVRKVRLLRTEPFHEDAPRHELATIVAAPTLALI